MFEVKEGQVEIDGVDIRTLDLQTFRSRLSVIPQDSILCASFLSVWLNDSLTAE